MSALLWSGAVAGRTQDRLPEGEGKVTVETLCATRCHPPSVVLRAKRTPAGWEKILDLMIQRGAEMSDSDTTRSSRTLSHHLLATVNVNTATADRIVEVLEIGEKEAAAIVESRKTHGPLKTWEDVARVSGVEAKFMEERKARLIF